MADAGLQLRSTLESLALPSGPRFALLEARPAARFILRGPEAVRVSCGMAFGAEPPSRLGSAGGSEGRAALWLGARGGGVVGDRRRRRRRRYRGHARVGARGNCP